MFQRIKCGYAVDGIEGAIPVHLFTSSGPKRILFFPFNANTVFIQREKKRTNKMIIYLKMAEQEFFFFFSNRPSFFFEKWQTK